MEQSYAFNITKLFPIVILLFLSTFKLNAQCEPVCKDNTKIYLCYESTVEVLPEDVLKPIQPECLKDMVVDIFQNGDSLGNQVSYLLAGQTLDVRLTDTLSHFTCQSTITIERDSTPPTAVCDEFTVTTLPLDGYAVLCADNFDSGSYDNCFLQSIKIRRMDDNSSFKNCIRVSCSDVGAPIMVILQATDYEGLTDICMIELSVQEKIAPVINCPDDIDISCKFDPFDVNVTGIATATDNCHVKEITHTDSDLRNDCGVGVIERTWMATDDAGNTSTCVQKIRTIWER
ncbi:MAG TPA: hypothetical protein ENI82_02640, partial [Bacteroidetes bacterium]|nr:hypothetical protein [Bacteroidota bacterium]